MAELLDSFFQDVIQCTTNGSYEELIMVLLNVIKLSIKQPPDSEIITPKELSVVIHELYEMGGLNTEHNDLEPSINIASMLLDIIWILDIEIEEEQERGRLAELVQFLTSMNLVPTTLAWERLEADLLEKAMVIQDGKGFEKKIVRTRTALLYKQTKFNLLREESEGYSRLCTDLMEHLIQPLDYYWTGENKKLSHEELKKWRLEKIDHWSSLVNKNLSSLIGTFDLDPNRVLDIVLDLFASNILDHWEFFVHLLLYSPWKPVNNVPKPVVAQILGFKFGYFKAKEKTPSQLFWVAAIMIKSGLLSLDDIYPHLYPADEDIGQEFMNYLERINEKGKTAGRFGPTLVKICLTKLMGQLEDSSGTKKPGEATKQEEETIPLGNPFNQKAGLVHALAAIGDLKNSRIILDRIPQLAQMHPAIADAFSRVIHVVIENVEEPLRPLSDFAFSKDATSVDQFMPAIPSLNLITCPRNSKVSVGRKSYPPSQQFFYSNWKSDIPVPTTCSGVVKVLKSILVYVGPHLYRDVLLVGKLIRIGKFHLMESKMEESVKNFWLSIISQCIFPAVSQMLDNSPIMHDLWNLLELFHYSTRYALYGEWRHITYESIPELAIAASGCRKDIQYIMNRLSKDNIKTYGRLIGKIVHSNPTIAFSYILNAIEGYDNMIPFVVEATRYLTDVEFDILCYCLLEALSRESKVRIERNGTTIEKWLKSLSSFCGMLFKRHNIDLDGILQYIANQLLSDQVYDLVVFQELISSMSGTNPPEDATVVQMDGYAGGPVLRRETLLAESQTFSKSAARLAKSLSSTDLAAPLGILIAQQRKEIVYRFGKNDDDPFMIPDLKVLAWLNDHCQRTFLQYFGFLADSTSNEVYSSILPSLSTLINKYGIDVAAAFHISRPNFSSMLKYRVSNDSMDVDAFPLALPELVEEVGVLEIAGCVPVLFFVVFWQLDLSDISIPAERYESEIKKRLDAIALLDKQTDSKSKKTRKKEKDRLLTCHNALCEEFEKQKLKHDFIMNRIMQEKDLWFAELKSSRQKTVMEFLQTCIYPRCIMSPSDASFCAKFVLMLHDIGVANSSSLYLFDNILNQGAIHAVLFSLTECEAKNYGLFLGIILEQLTSWHLSKPEYDNTAIAGRPGFIIDVHSASIDQTSIAENQYLLYEDYRTIMHKWHVELRLCFLSSLESKEYMQLRNGMIILDKISKFFPLMTFMGTEFEKTVQTIEKTEERADVKQMARSYYAKLRFRKPSWIKAKEFWNQPENFKENGELEEENEVQESGEMMDIEQEPGEVDAAELDHSEPGEISLNAAEEKNEDVVALDSIDREVVIEKAGTVEVLVQPTPHVIEETEEFEANPHAEQRREEKPRRDRHDSSQSAPEKRRKVEKEERSSRPDRELRRKDRERDSRANNENRSDRDRGYDEDRKEPRRRQDDRRKDTPESKPNRSPSPRKEAETVQANNGNVKQQRLASPETPKIELPSSQIVEPEPAAPSSPEVDLEALERQKIRDEKDRRLKLLLQKELAAENAANSVNREEATAEGENLNRNVDSQEGNTRRVIIDRISKSMERPVKFQRPNISKESENVEPFVKVSNATTGKKDDEIPRSRSDSFKLEANPKETSNAKNTPNSNDQSSISIQEPDQATEVPKKDEDTLKEEKGSERKKTSGRDGVRVDQRDRQSQRTSQHRSSRDERDTKRDDSGRDTWGSGNRENRSSGYGRDNGRGRDFEGRVDRRNDHYDSRGSGAERSRSGYDRGDRNGGDGRRRANDRGTNSRNADQKRTQESGDTGGSDPKRFKVSR